MAAIPEQQMLALVEQAAMLTPLDRAVRIVAALERIPPARASQWPLDARDRALIAGRREMFGPALPFVVRCRACGETMESALDCDELLEVDGEPDVQVRAPTSVDLADAARAGDPALLAARCAPGLDLSPDELETRIERAFPLLDVHVELGCEGCGAAIVERFDIVRYFWSELERRALQLLDDVHLLAAAYGWNETEILALGPARRRAYLDRIAA